MRTNERKSVRWFVETSRSKERTNIDGYKFEQTVLGQYGYNYFMPCLAVVIEQGNTARMGLDKKPCRII